MAGTYWHVAPASYRPGDDLLCWDKLAEQGVVTDADWKWDDAPVGHDGHMVSLFRDTEQGREERDWLAGETPGAQILRIDFTEEDTEAGNWGHAEIRMTRAADEPYPGVWGSIPARCITVVNANCGSA